MQNYWIRIKTKAIDQCSSTYLQLKVAVRLAVCLIDWGVLLGKVLAAEPLQWSSQLRLLSSRVRCMCYHSNVSSVLWTCALAKVCSCILGISMVSNHSKSSTLLILVGVLFSQEQATHGVSCPWELPLQQSHKEGRGPKSSVRQMAQLVNRKVHCSP